MSDAVPLFEMEQAVVDDPERKLALFRDEAEFAGRRAIGRRDHVLRRARAIAQDDPGLAQELGTSILERFQGGEAVLEAERQEAADLFVSLAEMYDGDHGFAYSTAALDVMPGHDRAMQLAAHYARALSRTAELPSRWAAYLAANPNGALADEARSKKGDAAPPPAPPVAAAVAPPLAAELRGPAPSGLDSIEGRSELPRLLEAASLHASKGQKAQSARPSRRRWPSTPATRKLSRGWRITCDKRQYAELRDVLLSAVRSPNAAHKTKKQQLLEVAGLCESQLRDIETAIQAYKQICHIDRSDTAARDNLRRLLERGARWDDLAATIEQEAMGTSDVEAKIVLEKKLAQLHEVKRKDLVSAGEAWARIAALLPGDEASIQTAIKLFDKGQRRDSAAQVIAETRLPSTIRQPARPFICGSESCVKKAASTPTRARPLRWRPRPIRT